MDSLAAPILTSLNHPTSPLFSNMSSDPAAGVKAMSDDQKETANDKLKDALKSDELKGNLTEYINGLVGSALQVDDVFWKVESKLKYIDTNGITDTMRSEIARLSNSWTGMKNVCTLLTLSNEDC